MSATITGTGFRSNNNLDQVHSYQVLLEENIELKKIISKIENQLKRENNEKTSLQKIHEDFKQLHEKTRKELAEMNNKLILSLNDRNSLERKYENELEKQRNFFLSPISK